MIMEIIKITNDNFEKEVLGSDIPVLVDFWAAWCGPCMMQGPVLDELAGEYDTIKIGKINVDEEQLLAMKFNVTGIPTMIYFKDGEAAQKMVGLRSKEQLIQALDLQA